MPGQFLSQAEREQLQSFPEEITFQELITFFTLSDKDLTQVKKRSGDHNLLGFALQLGTLRYLSFIPDDFPQLPEAVVNYVAEQLNIAPSVLSAYGEREQTRTNQLQEIQDYLGFRKPNRLDYKELGAWLLSRAMEHDRPLLLFQLLIKKLETSKIIRPGLTILERMVATARNEAWTETCKRLKPILTDSREKFLDSLLEVDSSLGRTPLAWLRTGAVSNSPRAILNALAKLDFLNQQNVKDWDVSVLNPNRLKFLAKLGKKYPPQALSRTPAARRYSILIAFCRHGYTEIIDETIDLYISTLANAYARSKKDRDKFQRRIAQSLNQKLKLLNKIGQVILDEEIKNEELRTALRSGNIWLSNSRRYANPESYLIPKTEWLALKSEVCQQIQVSELGTPTIEQRCQELSALLSQFDASFKDNEQVRIEKDKLVVSNLKAEEVPDSTRQLRKQIQERLPWIELTNLLIEIDNLTGFSQTLVHAGDSENRTTDIKRYLYAAIIAQACNIGLERMARLASLSYHQLAWCNNWYLRESTLKAANTEIVNFQYHLPLSKIWGGGTLSSSDGQRFPVSVKNRIAVSLPRYFGYGQGVTFYTWTSDQFSQYGVKVTPSTILDFGQNEKVFAKATREPLSN